MRFEIDGNNYQIAKKGVTVLQACLEVGIAIPRFCFHDKLTIAGNCRMCLVEVSANPRSKKPLASCALPLSNDMVIYTNTILVRKARESVLEFLLANHPLDCPICDQGGECDLQDQSFFFGNDKSRFYENKRVVSDKFCGPFIKTIMTRCIHCTRCVRFATEIAGVDFFGVTGRGSSMEIGTYVEKIFNSELSGNIIDLCPVGALTSKTYSFLARPWELRSVEGIDIFDTFGSRIRIDSRGLEILRILPSHNKYINEEWINDKIRFSYDGLQKQRLNIPMFRNSENFMFAETSWSFVFIILFDNLFNNLLLNKNFSYLSFILGKNVDLSVFYILKKKFNFFFLKNASIFCQNFILNFKFDILNFFFFNYLILDVKNRDAFILFLLNPRLEIPLFNLKIRKNFLQNSNFFTASFGYVTNLTYPVFHCGNTTKDIFDFLKGKNLLCRKILQLKNPFFIFSEHFIKLFKKNFYNLFLKIVSSLSNFSFSFKKYFFFYNFKILLSKNGFLNFSLLNFFNFKKIENEKNSSLIFLIDTDKHLINTNIKFLYKNFYIYIGSHGNSDAEISNIIMPSTTFVESCFTYINLEGRIQTTQYSIISPINNREPWKILYNIFLYFLRTFYFITSNNNKFFKLFFNYDFSILSVCFLINSNKTYVFSNSSFLLLLNSFFNLNFLDNNNINLFSNYFKILDFDKIYSLNKIFLINTTSFFRGDVITRSSKFMNLGFLEFEMNELNF